MADEPESGKPFPGASMTHDYAVEAERRMNFKRAEARRAVYDEQERERIILQSQTGEQIQKLNEERGMLEPYDAAHTCDSLGNLRAQLHSSS